MEKKAFTFLKNFIETPSPSGYEATAQKVWAGYVKKYASITKDVHGNCWGTINPKGAPRVMLAGHVDEIGLIVKYIDDNGFLYFGSIGGIDWNVMPGNRVNIHTEKGPILGVMGRKPIHLMKPEERKKGVDATKLWIDIGAKKKKEAEKLVAIGDPVTVAVGLEKLRNNRIASRACDDKAGSFIVARVLEILSKRRIAASVFGVSTVQEEIGTRGAITSAFGINLDVGIAIDVCHASDQPTVDKKETGETKLGGGPVICRGPNINPIVYKHLVAAAKRKKIPYQLEAYGGVTPTDARAIQTTRSGVAAGLVSIPNRYMHTPVEIVSLDDLENCAKLLAEFIAAMPKKISFIP